MISIVVPTVQGREDFLRKCLDSYAAHTTDYEVHVIADRPTCGDAWVEGAAECEGDYIHFSADDLQPLKGWSEAARYFADKGVMAAPRIVNGDGSLQSCGGTDQDSGPFEQPTGTKVDFTRIPFMTREQWERIRPLAEDFLRGHHYYTDNAIGWAATAKGISMAVHREFAFIHYLAQEKRGAGMTEPERMRFDREDFRAFAR